MDQESFDDFYTANYSRIYAFCRGMLRNEQDALDATQETFIKVWAARAAFDPSRAARLTLTYTIARNTCLDKLQARQRLATAVEHLYKQPLPPCENPQDTDRHQLYACLNLLPEEDRIVMLLRHMIGFTLQATCDLMKMTMHQVRVAEQKAALSLRACLKDTLEAPSRGSPAQEI